MLSGCREQSWAYSCRSMGTGIKGAATANRRHRARAAALAILCVALAFAVAGCGSGSSGDASASSTADATAAANNVDLSAFPKTDGKKTFRQIQAEAKAKQDGTLLPAANDFVAGRENRLPFGLFAPDRTPIWGPTVMYFSAGTDEPATGPVAVAAHDLKVPAQFRSKTSANDYQTIGNGFYDVSFKVPKDATTVNVLTLTDTGSATQAAATGLAIKGTDPSPAPGDKVPAVDTPTLASVNGDASKIDTRIPPDKMHNISLKDALPLAKKENKPIVLVFATPALCASRVCGPVVDVASEVQAKEGNNVIFIHNEIYKNNDPNDGYRPQVGDFGLTSEPFTFVIAPSGRVVAQLQGPFVTSELEAAIAKAKSKT
jgi:hypothetical protein